MTTIDTLTALHNTLAVYYRQFRGVTAPESRDIADIWARIEREEQ